MELVNSIYFRYNFIHSQNCQPCNKSGRPQTPHIVSGSNNAVTGTITYLDALEMGIDSALTDETDDEAIVVGTSTLDQCEFKYGLIKNDDVINYTSKIDGNEQRYKYGGYLPFA